MIEIEARLLILYKQSPASKKDDILLMVQNFGWHVKKAFKQNRDKLPTSTGDRRISEPSTVFNSIPVTIYDLFCP